MSTLHRASNVTRSIPEALAGAAPSISFEFFPPKDDAGEAVLWEAIRRLEKTHPTFVSVTYGAGGSYAGPYGAGHQPDRDRHDVDADGAPDVRRSLGPRAALDHRHLRGRRDPQRAGLRGDPQGGLDKAWVAHPEGYDHADQLVRLVRGLGPFTVGVAAFPDQHPESASLDFDAEVLVRKADAGASFAITQFFFTVEAYVGLRDRVAARGRELPIIPGLMPVTNVRQLKRMTELSGQPVPAFVTDRLEAVADQPEAVREVGVEIATGLAQALLAEGAPGIHFITMNRSTATLQVWDNLGIDAAR